MAYTSKYNDEKANSPFATRLRTLAEERGASQAKIAEYVGCTYQAIGAYMRGETVPKLTDAQKIAEFFSVSIDYLAGKDECTSPDIQIIQNLLGLNEGTIEKLKKLKQDKSILSVAADELVVLNAVICDDLLVGVLCDYFLDNALWGEPQVDDWPTMYSLFEFPWVNMSKGKPVIYPKTPAQRDIIKAINMQRLQDVFSRFHDENAKELDNIRLSMHQELAEEIENAVSAARSAVSKEDTDAPR